MSNDKFDSCLIFAHRGANREAAENTRAAFDKALEYAIDGIETDVQLSRDGIPVLWHDPFLDKLDYAGKRIDDFDLEQLEQIDFSGYFSSETVPEGVLSLKEFINTYHGRCKLNIEIKNRDWESQERQEHKILQTLDIVGTLASEGVFISSFNLSSLIFAHQYAPDFPLFHILTDDHTQADIEQLLEEQAFLSGFCLPIGVLNSSICKLLRMNDKKIGAYTCNSTAEIRKAFKLKVDIIMTDCPQKALQMRGRWIGALLN
ncbi:MAG: glycerophosphodiester phosphodiesterase [Methylobacter sp.]|nr:glycerophosphodiester phosphodiesterase [Methylobacter sp.]